jgi:nicotinamide riboside transporter PnuC
MYIAIYNICELIYIYSYITCNIYRYFKWISDNNEQNKCIFIDIFTDILHLYILIYVLINIFLFIICNIYRYFEWISDNNEQNKHILYTYSYTLCNICRYRTPIYTYIFICILIYIICNIYRHFEYISDNNE